MLLFSEWERAVSGFMITSGKIQIAKVLPLESEPEKAQLVVDDVCIYFSEHKVTKCNKSVHLAPKEFKLLEFFVRHPQQIFCPEDLLEQVWGMESEAMHDTVRGHINRLRRKLDTPGKASYISSIYGFGYRFDPPNEF